MVPKQNLQCSQGIAVDRWNGQYTQSTTRGRLKHPRRYFSRETIPLLLETAPADGMPLLDEHLVDGDRTTEPWMEWIADFP